MYIHRLSVLGVLVLLAACAAAPRPQSVASPVTLTPVQAPAPAPAAAPKPAPAPAPTPAVTEVERASAAVPAAAVTRPARAAPVVRLPASSAPRPAPVIAAKPAAAPAHIAGRVVLTGARGQQVVAGDSADTLVYFVPKSGGAPTKPGNYTVYTHNRDFSPEAIAVPEGSKVTFVNLDDVRHNVFSVTPGSDFDLGYQAAGDKASHVFTRQGVVLVSCHVHRAMELDMLVVPTPYVGKVAADGSFDLRNLPAGPGTLHLWNPRAQPVSQAVTLPFAGSLTLKMLATRPRMTTQLNAGGTP